VSAAREHAPDFATLLVDALDEQIEAQTQLAALCDAQTGRARRPRRLSGSSR